MTAHLVDRGATGDIFAWGEKQVVKVLRREKQTHRDVIDWRDHEALIRLIYRSEVDAYIALSRRPDLAAFAPAFGGIVSTMELVERLSLDPSLYVSDCAFAMERLAGRAQKLLGLPESLDAQIRSTLETMRSECGIAYTIDVSCFPSTASRPFAVIDFAMRDIFGEYQPELEEHGVFPLHLRERLGLA